MGNLNRCTFVFFLMSFLVFGHSLKAQEEIFSLGMQLGSGSRAVAMGGAYSTLGGDYTASFWNPAALRNIKKSEISGSLSHLTRKNDFGLSNNLAFFNPGAEENEESFTKFNDLGAAYVVPTIQGSMVFSFGFNRVKSYDSNLNFDTFNSSEDDQLNQVWREFESGGLNAWTLGGAVDVSPNASVGIGLNFWSGHTELESTFGETDVNNIYENAEGEDFHSLFFENRLESDITGFNLKVGGLFQVNQMLDLGLTVSTPITFKVEEDQFFNEEIVFDDGFSESVPTDGFFEYKLKSPWMFSAGASFHVGNIILAGDLEYADWSQIEYKSDPPFLDSDGTTYTQGEANSDIRSNYRATTKVRLGAELNFPIGMSIRGGYFKDPSVFQNVDPDEDKQFLSAGIGFNIDKQVRLDIAFVHGFWKSFNSQLPVPASELLGELDDPPSYVRTNEIGDYVEDIKLNQVFISLSFAMDN